MSLTEENTSLTENQFFMEFIEETDIMCVMLLIEEDIQKDGTVSVLIDMEVVTYVSFQDEQELIETLEEFFQCIFDNESSSSTTTSSSITSSSTSTTSSSSSGLSVSDIGISGLSVQPDKSKLIRTIPICDQFDDYEKVAKIFVDNLLQDANADNAVAIPTSSTSTTTSSTLSSSYSVSSSTSSSCYYGEESSSSHHVTIINISCGCLEEEVEEEQVYEKPRKPVEWPTIENFTAQLGLNTIKDFIKRNWIPPSEWHYNVYLMLEQSDKCTDYYTYQTIWSLPNQEYPVPQVYTSIYFIIKVSRIKPTSCLVDVCYHYEGCIYRFNVENSVLNEDLLYKILKSKLDLYQRLTF